MPNGYSLVASYLLTYNQNQHVYQVQCVGQSSAFRHYADTTIARDDMRQSILGFLDLEPENPTIILSALMDGRVSPAVNSIDLDGNEVNAIIVQSRALNCRGSGGTGTEACLRCLNMISRRGNLKPFTRCAKVPVYDGNVDVCANCILEACDYKKKRSVNVEAGPQPPDDVREKIMVSSFCGHMSLGHITDQDRSSA